jgi:hypothetical protein
MRRRTLIAAWTAACLVLAPVSGFADEPAVAESATSAAGDVVQEAPPARESVADIATLGVIGIGSFAAGAGMLAAASGTFSDRDAIDGDGLYDNERRNTLDLKGQSQQVLGAVFIGLGALATTGFGVLAARHVQAKRGGDLAVAPVLHRRGLGVTFSARF